MSTDQAQNTIIKIPYNKRVEQNLKHDLSVFIKENNNKVSEAFDIQIPEFLLEVIITESSKISAQNIANLFIIAMKVRQKEILCWYCFYKAYEDRIKDIKCINKIDNQSARILVYNKIKKLLPDITDINLHQKTFKAKKIYTLLVEIEIEKIQTIICNASAISSLIDNQIQDIIIYFSKKFISIDDSSTLPKTEISITTTPSISLSQISNLEDIVNKNSEFSEIVNVFDGFSDFNSDSNEDKKNIDDTNKNDKYDNETNLKDSTKPKADLCQYAIDHKIDPEKFLIITKAEKNRWTIECFSADLERNI
ncbi:19303_t:CDS:2 [Cetraspora pellucida]|uniref:19303_t:CDS:1 n=1 Tax=Cetraspora pellucida TaxID=1433469 RepID=A0A9N9FWL8_9GLOM|nr:19303_t:CDS:2 [Cetraspora pellucida]